jgi:hypothetical protein
MQTAAAAIKLIPDVILPALSLAQKYRGGELAKVLGGLGFIRRPGVLARFLGPVGLVGVGVALGAGAALALSPELRAKVSSRLKALDSNGDKKNQPAEAG